MARQPVLSASTSTFRRCALTAAIGSALLGMPLRIAAQIAPDPNAGIHRPDTQTAANGVPVVNIAAPSAAGVSHNAYQQFNVGAEGLILNNNAAVSATQLAGYIVGNPNYRAGQSARVIVNEVTSNLPSSLRGYTEVAGNAADIVIANPNGISVSGGGFINTPHATLTTGTPVFGGDGSLSGFRVARGTIAIDGNGLNAAAIDRLDLIARSITADAKVWANNLNAVTGSNQVDYTSLAVQTLADDGAAPAIGLDVAALGGMYANKIRLIGTGAGVGVRNAGELASQTGDFIIDQRGHIQLTGLTSSAGNLTLHATQLDHSGILQAGGDMTMQLAAGVVNDGTIYSAHDINIDTDGAVTNRHIIAAANDSHIVAEQVTSTGTLGAGVAADGTLQGSGSLSVTARGRLAANGSNLSSGALSLQGSALDLSGAQTRAGHAIALTSTDGSIDHAHATLVAGDALTIRSAGRVGNTDGVLQAARIDAQAAAFDNAYGSVMQTGTGPMNIAIGGMLDNTHGTWSANAQTMALRAGTLLNTDGVIAHAGDGVLDIDTRALSNAQGQIVGNGKLALHADILGNQNGLLSVAGDAAVTATDLDNSAGRILVRNLQANVDGNVSNQDGTLQASDSLQLNAQALDNGSGQIKALQGDLGLVATQAWRNGMDGFIGGNRTVAITAGTLANDGHVYAGNDLLLAVHGDTRNQGAMQAQGNLHAIVDGALRNDAGQLEAGNGQGNASLTLDAAALTNRGGRIANADNGLTAIHSASYLDNTAGTVGGQGDVALSSAQLSNSQGTLVAGGNFALQSDDLNNRSGTLYSAGDLSWNNDAATFDNTQGSLGAGGDIALQLGAVSNEGGDISANRNIAAQFNAFDGIGRMRAGDDLGLTLNGDYTNRIGNSLFANGSFTFNLSGALTNASGAELKSAGALTVNATRIDNQAEADIASASTTLNAASQTNQGRIEGDIVTLNAGDITNTGTVIGNAVTINADSLVNGMDLGSVTDNNPYQTALIAAADHLNLYIRGDLLNRDALLYTLGDLTIAADADGTRSRSVTNLSGDIEAGGNVFIATGQFNNQRRVLTTETHQLTDAEQAQNTQSRTVAISGATDSDLYDYCTRIYVPHEYACRNNGDLNNNDPLQASGYIVTRDIITAITRVTAASAESRLLAGGNITLNGSVLNSNATIAAGNNLSINGQDGRNGGGNVGNDTVRNIAFTPTATVQTTVEKSVSMKHKSGDFGGDWHGDPDLTFSRIVDDVTLAASAIPFLTLDPGASFAASISAGNAVDISARDIANTVVDADGRPVIGIGLGAHAPHDSVTGHGGPGAQTVGDSAYPLGPIQLPANGLYTIHPGAGSPYLVETDPRFATYKGFLGSDYLLQQLQLGGDTTLKRLGDAFYETQLVIDQITSLTGRRYLSGDSDALDQYRALMDAGVQQAQSFDLAVGVALTPQQIASLGQDMVWLVTQNVGGEQVLVPVVYLSQNTANALASGALIQGGNVSLNAGNTLLTTGAVQSSQDTAIQAGNLLNAGSIVSGGNLSMQAAQGLLNTGTLQGGNIALAAGDTLTSTSGARTLDLGSVHLDGLALPDAQRLGVPGANSIAATGTLTAQAGNNLVPEHTTVQTGQQLGLVAGNDVTVTASTLNAGGDAQLIAGHDLTLNADRHTVYQGSSDHLAVQTLHDLDTIHTGGSAQLVAGNDLVSLGAQLDAGRQLTLSAAHDLTLDAVVDAQITQGYSRQGTTHITTLDTDQALRGTRIEGTDGVIVSAGHDLDSIAGNIASANGNVTLNAGNDIHLDAGYENHTTRRDTTQTRGNLLSSTTTTTHDASQDRIAIGTLLSGDGITVAAGHDLSTQAAQIAATDELVMAAGGNLDIAAATSTHSEQHQQTTHTTGAFTSGMGVMIGSRKLDQTGTLTAATPEGSLLGSVDGNVTLAAGNDVHITGSDIISQTGTSIVGRNVTIDAAVGVSDTGQTYTVSQGGINVGFGGALAQAASAAYGAVQGANQTTDGRLSALYTARAAYQTSHAIDAAQAGVSQTGNDGGINLQLGIGGSHSSTSTAMHDETAYGSDLRSAGTITIAATGGDLNLIGSHISGENVALAAANNLNILSQTESHTLESQNSNAGGGVGVQIGSSGMGFYAQASAGKGSAHGNGTTHAISSVDASDRLALISGNDTTIKGARLAGDTVLASIGNNLLIQSEQDTDDYASKQWQAGGQVVIGMGGGGSFSYNQNKVDSHYAGVTNVSGIQAGNGGFAIAVGGTTQLIGGVIASSADRAKNLLDTGMLAYSSIDNNAHYKASQIGVSAGYGNGSGVRPALSPGQSDKSSSTSQAGIANGTLLIRNGATDLGGLNRDPSLASHALENTFDPQKVQEQMAFAGGLNDFAMQVIDDTYSAKLARKQMQIDAINADADDAMAHGDTARAGQLYEQVAYMRDERDRGHDPAIAKGIASVAVGALSGHASLSSALTYTAWNSGIGFTQDEAGKAARGHRETATIKVTCTLPAQECANLRIPESLTTEQRVQYLRDQGMSLTFMDQIPASAENIALNGILNDEARAGQVQTGHVSQSDGDIKGITYYVQYNASKGGFSDLFQSGYDKFISPLNGDYSATIQASREAVERQGAAPVNLFAHSWGSIVARNVLNLLVEDGYKNPDFTTAVFGPAVRPEALVTPMLAIAGWEKVFPVTDEFGNRPRAALIYLSSPQDVVATLVAGTVFPSKYLDSNSPQHLSGAAQGEFWGALGGAVPVFQGPENPHSCYGLNCAGSPYNWTIEKAEQWHKIVVDENR